MTIAEDMTVEVERVPFPPAPSPDITIPFETVLAMMEGLRRHAREVERSTHLFPQQVAFWKGCADVLGHAVDRAGWEL